MPGPWYPDPLPESPAEIVEAKRLWAVYGARSGAFIAFTSDPETAAHYQRSGYLVEESAPEGEQP